MRINWRKDAQWMKIPQKEILSKVKELLRYHQEKMLDENKKHNIFYWDEGSWMAGRDSLKFYLYIQEDGSLKVYFSNMIDDDKNTNEFTGKDAVQAFAKRFHEYNGVTLKKAFGYVDKEFKQCVPKSFYYQNDGRYANKVMDMSSVDWCSHYPSCLCGRLPDAHDTKELDGTVKPTEEYPFAFYIKSGHVAEYGVFDTHDWLDYILGSCCFRAGEDEYSFKDIPSNEDKTILMKASKYNMTKEWEYYYSMRKQDPIAKLVMNATIGYFHKKYYNNYKLAHIAAVCIARANTKMLELTERIGPHRIIQVCVDGCLYTSSSETYGGYEKKLGNLEQEFINKPGIWTGMNIYIIKTGENTCKKKHGAYDVHLDGKTPIDKEFHGFNEIYDWKRNII